ncbi:MAG TPA: hypothetical protein VFK66_04160 [Oryzihumus sp.]|nr:hypothetical protein [Oryzihumus sp.]
MSGPSDDVAVFSVVDLARDEDLAGEVLLWGIDLHNRSAHPGISLLPEFRAGSAGHDSRQSTITTCRDPAPPTSTPTSANRITVRVPAGTCTQSGHPPACRLPFLSIHCGTESRNP